MHQEKNWEAIAMRITNEQDSQRLNELTQQLISALDEEETNSAKVESRNTQNAPEETTEGFNPSVSSCRAAWGSRHLHRHQ